MRNRLHKIFRRKVGVKTLNPGVKFFSGVVPLCKLAYLAAWNYVIKYVPKIAVYSVNATVDISSPTLDVIFNHCGRLSTVETWGRGKGFEFVSSEPELSSRLSGVVDVPAVDAPKIGFSERFSSCLSSFTSFFKLKTPTAFRSPVCNNFCSAIASKLEHAPASSALNRIIGITIQLFEQSKLAVSIPRFSFYSSHVVKNGDWAYNSTTI